MLVCMGCRSVLEEQGSICLCGSEARADVLEDGTAVALYEPHGAVCQRCGDSDQDLAFRRYRRVFGGGLMDRIYTESGYYCRPCRAPFP
jgi:hypothetical protein